MMVTIVALASLFADRNEAIGAVAGSKSYSTTFCGRIIADTTWTSAGSPYNLSCNLTVDAGVTLSIGPGVQVNVGPNHAIQVLGTLVADGSAGDPVVFQSSATW